MNKFAIVAKKDEISTAIESKIKSTLEKSSWSEDKQLPDLVFCVGGDGTFLFAAHKYMGLDKKVALLAIHTGTLGFFTDYTKEEVDECLLDVLNKEATYVNIPLLKIEVTNEKKNIYYAINEMRIENVIRTQDLVLHIDNEYFENFRGTGICLCTQAGSTAYNRSLKGAVVDSGLNLMQLQEITGIHHSLYHSLGVPLILNNHRTITFSSSNYDDAILCFDHEHIQLNGVSVIKASMSEMNIQFARYRRISYLERIRNLY